MPNPIDDEPLYNSIVLGGKKSPGVVKLSGHDRATKWDVQNAQSTSGATTVFKGEPPIEFTATFYLVRDDAQGIDQFTEWDAFLPVIQSTLSGNTPKALDIYHPDLETNGIKSVVKASVGGVQHDGKGGQTVVVKFQEYRKAKPKPSAPVTSAAKPVDPNADVNAQLAAALASYQATPWG